MKVGSKECQELKVLLEEADKAGMLQFVLKSAISFSSFLTIVDVVNQINTENDFEVDPNVIYLIRKDLKEWKEKENNFSEEISVTIKGFNKIEEAQEFCNWYSGQGEQNSSIWFECRQVDNVIDVSAMYASSSSLTSNTNVEMILKMYK